MMGGYIGINVLLITKKVVVYVINGHSVMAVIAVSWLNAQKVCICVITIWFTAWPGSDKRYRVIRDIFPWGCGVWLTWVRGDSAVGIKVSQAIQTIEATIADAEIAPLLDARVGEPLLKAERIVFDKKKKPIEYVFTLYRADKYCFTVKLDRKRSKEFVGWKAVKQV